MNIYVASSWRNQRQQECVKLLRLAGHKVYDFKNPKPEDNGFHWSDIDQKWKQWNSVQFRNALNHQLAISGFEADFQAMKWADACVLLLPCGRSAHLEAGYFIGAKKRLIICLPINEAVEPELMYRMAEIVVGSRELIKALSREDKK